MARNPKIDADLLALAAMSDDEIDTSDIPEILEFESPEIGRYSGVVSRNYDVRSIANWAIRASKESDNHISKLWLNKFVFFIVEFALKNRRVLLTPARIEAWEFGPVFRELYFNFPKNEAALYQRYNVQKRIKEVASEPFETDDIEIFKIMWNKYANLTAAELTRISHRKGSPWHEVWERGGKVNPGMVIDVATILGRDLDDSNERN